MDYPTRQEAQEAYDFASKYRLVLERVKNKQFLNIHDALDAKQAELDGRTEALDWTANRCDELALEAGLTKIELDKAHNFIKRINDKLKTWCGLIPWANEFITDANKILGVD